MKNLAILVILMIFVLFSAVPAMAQSQETVEADKVILHLIKMPLLSAQEAQMSEPQKRAVKERFAKLTIYNFTARWKAGFPEKVSTTVTSSEVCEAVVVLDAALQRYLLKQVEGKPADAWNDAIEKIVTPGIGALISTIANCRR